MDYESSKSQKILFTGDVMINSEYWDSDPYSSNLRERIQDADLAVTNLEAPCETHQYIEKFGSNLSSTQSDINTIHKMGFDTVSLSNNHIRDFGLKGIEKTVQECRRAGIDVFGAGQKHDKAIKPFEVTISGVEVGIIGVSEYEGSIATEEKPGAAWAYDAKNLDRIRELSSNFDISCVVAHGGLEYVPIPPTVWREQLRMFAETKIDAVIGHHPHTPQGWEVYNETPIFYSLGNFMMYNQDRPSTHWSYGVELSWDHNADPTASIVKFAVRDGFVDIMQDEQSAPYQAYLDKSSEIIQTENLYQKYWQAIADKLYYDEGYRYQYNNRFDQYGKGHITSLLSNPVLELDRLTRGIFGSKARREKELALLDIVQSRSHINAVQTALSDSKSFDIHDDEFTDELDQLFSISDGTLDRGCLKVQKKRAYNLINRLMKCV